VAAVVVVQQLMRMRLAVVVLVGILHFPRSL
jgi:hypothetical protein